MKANFDNVISMVQSFINLSGGLQEWIRWLPVRFRESENNTKKEVGLVLLVQIDFQTMTKSTTHKGLKHED